MSSSLGLEAAAQGGGGPLPITSSRMGHLVDALEHAYRVLGLEEAAGGDEVFRQLVLARIIEPSSKLDSLRVLEEAGAGGPSYATLKRRLPAYAKEEWRQGLSAACAAHARLGPASLVLYDVSTLYFETDQGDGFREPGFSKERRLEPQITIGLLTGQDGFPLMVSAFEGNKAETKTMLPVIEAFMAAHRLPDVTVVADAGMISEANQKAIEAAGLSFILGMKIPDVPYEVDEWRRGAPRGGHPRRARLHPALARRAVLASAGQGYLLPATGRPGPPDPARHRRAGRQGRQGRRRPGPGQAEPVHRPRRRGQERQPRPGGQGQEPGRAERLRHQPRRLPRRDAGHRRLRDRLLPPAPRNRESFRMSKSDLQARPIYHHKRDSIEAHLTIVFAALAVTRWIEAQTGWSIRKFVRTTRPDL